MTAFEGETLGWEAIWGPGLHQLLEWRDLSSGYFETYIPLADHRNSIVGLWSVEDYALVEIGEYDEHGRLTVRDNAEQVVCEEFLYIPHTCRFMVGMPFGFGSMWRSDKTGLIHMGYRWYSPRLGQFTSHDPLEYIDSYNLYAYAAFDPVNGWDPWGLANMDFAGGANSSQAGAWGDGGPLVGYMLSNQDGGARSPFNEPFLNDRPRDLRLHDQEARRPTDLQPVVAAAPAAGVLCWAGGCAAAVAGAKAVVTVGVSIAVGWLLAHSKDAGDEEGDNWRQHKPLSDGEIELLKEGGVDIHDLKGEKGASTRDLYKNPSGEIFVRPKRTPGNKGEPTGLNINDF